MIPMIIDHICFAVNDLQEAVAYWARVFGYTQRTGIVTNSRQRVYVVFLDKESSLTIKLIQPLPENHALLNFVNRGGGFHHICFRCADVQVGISEFKAKGLRTLVAPQPGEAFNNHPIAFMRARFGINFELIDTEERADLLDL